MRSLPSAAPWQFYTDLLPRIKAWALDDLTAELPIMKPYDPNSASVSVTPRVARHLLANAFFLNIVLLEADVRMRYRLGELSYYGLYTNNHPPSVERITCQIAFVLLLHTHSSQSMQSVASASFATKAHLCIHPDPLLPLAYPAVSLYHWDLTRTYRFFFNSAEDSEVLTRPPIVFERSWAGLSVEKRTEFWTTCDAPLLPCVSPPCATKPHAQGDRYHARTHGLLTAVGLSLGECCLRCSPRLCSPERVNVHAQSMEDMPGKAFVDFANSARYLHL